MQEHGAERALLELNDAGNTDSSVRPIRRGTADRTCTVLPSTGTRMASAISEIDQLLRSLAADKAKEVPQPLPAPPPPPPVAQTPAQHKVAVVPQVQTPSSTRLAAAASAPKQPSSVLHRGALPAGMPKSSVIRSKSGSPSSRKLLAGTKPRQSFT